jgi:hypothetical protein
MVLITSRLGHTRVHVRVLVGLTRDRRGQVHGRRTDRQTRSRIACLFQILEMAVSMTCFAFSRGAEY